MDASYRSLSLILACLLAQPIAAAEKPLPREGSLDSQVQLLLDRSLDLETELRVAEDELVPVRQRLEVIVSLGAGDHFRLRELEIALDGKPLAKHIYSPVEIAALRAGTAQRLYVGNPALGQHRLSVKYAGRGGAGSVGGATLVFTTGTAAQLIEIALNDYVGSSAGDEPLAPAVELKLSNQVLPP